MLRFTRLVLKDFGPFKGRQELPFSDRNGVTFIVGQNGRGKTTLFNAFRYALIGKIYGRSGRERRDLTELANVETARTQGYPSFKVHLDFTYGGSEYSIQRILSPAGPDNQPTVQALLTRDGRPLSQEAIEPTLSKIIPESIHQFFLFDSEHLAKYEALLDDSSDAGDRLRSAIERILGVPILRNAEADLEALEDEISQAVAAQTQSDEEGSRLQAEIQNLRDQIKAEEDSLQQLDEEIDEYEERLSEVERMMSDFERSRNLLVQRDAENRRRDGLIVSISESLERYRRSAAEAWNIALASAVESPVADRQAEREELQRRVTRAQIERELLRDLDQHPELCPTCEQSLDPALSQHLRDQVAATNAETFGALERRLSEIGKELDSLAGAAPDPSRAALLRDREAELARLRSEKLDCDQTIEDLNRQLRNVSETEVRRLAESLRNYSRLLDNKREQRAALEEGLAEHRQTRAELTGRAARLPGADPSLSARHGLVRKLVRLMGQSIDEYRSRLRAEVQSQATKLFLLMRHETEYDALQINDQYGLNILHSDGSTVSGRSSGEEQVVAFSLMGALQNSAAVQGPIVVDMPFGRLDDEHKRQIIAALPEMSDQIILLAFEGEFDAHQARNDLGAQLVAERSLNRQSSRHTEIGEVR